MQYRQVAEGAAGRTFVVILEPGEEVLTTLAGFAAENAIAGASLTAIGAFQGATIGWFDLPAKSDRKIPVQEQCEALIAIGDGAEGDDGRPSLHVHAVLGLSDGTMRDGHLLEAHVQPTREVILIETPMHLRRRRRPELGIALIDLSSSRI
ncbi:MAG: DNA-binding protein [Rhizobiales bacterium]|nr:DNA-binding protein [Hyphomicrobiales bacterium]